MYIIKKKLTPIVNKELSQRMNEWEGQKFLRPIFFSIYLRLIYPI